MAHLVMFGTFSTLILLTTHSAALVLKPLQTQEQLRATDGKKSQFTNCKTYLRYLQKRGSCTSFTERSVTVRMPHPPHDMPAALRGRNLVIAGDSVDRQAAGKLCELYGADHFFNLTKMNADQGSVSGDGRGGYGCHMTDFDVSLLYLHHPGVMSLSPQPSWHAEFNQRNPQRHARLWHFDNGTSLNSSTDLARIYWRRAVEDNLPKRPVVILAQSSLWDSILAKEYLLKQGLNLDLKYFENAFQKTFGSAVPGWSERASVFLQTLWDAGLPIEKKIWRTNANCPVSGPEAPFVNEISHMQASQARRLIANKEGSWNGVRLMDWRKDFNATSPGWCNGIHYSHDGYLTYIQSLWDALA